VNIKILKKDINKVILDDFDVVIIPCCKKNPFIPNFLSNTKFKKVNLQKLISKSNFNGEKNEILHLINPINYNINIIFASCGNKINSSAIEETFNISVRKAIIEKYERILIFSNYQKINIDNYESFIARGSIWGSYKFENFKTNNKLSISLVFAHEKHSTRKINNGIMQGNVFHRIADLANSPANFATPSKIAEYANQLSKKNDIKVNIFNEKQLKEKKCEGILSVANGSINEPRLIFIEKLGSSKKQPIIIIGKTVTFDTGGISLKSSNAMEWMRYDKSGGMAVLALMEILSNFNLNQSVIGILGAAENMPGGNATKPGDIIKSYNGQTIEILNTDAEGRLILADALGIAAELNPECIIDIATLTGAVISALGNSAAGILGNNNKLIKSLQISGNEVGEKLWELPIYDDFINDMKSDFADLSNMSKSGTAGTATAAAFLSNFVNDEIPWAHIDIAGMAWKNKSNIFQESGATLFGTRLLLEWLNKHKVIKNF